MAAPNFKDFECAGDAFFALGRQPCRGPSCVEAPVVSLAPKEQQQQQQQQQLAPPSALDSCAYCVFDTETSGTSNSDVVIQFALGLFAEDGRALQFYDRLWKLPPNVRINKRAYDVHKIGCARLNRDGMDAKAQMFIIARMLGKLKARGVRIVAHNSGFDIRMLKQTAAAHGVSNWAFDKEETFCTMAHARDCVKAISTKTGKLKMPSNLECYRHLHNGNHPQFGALHDAVADVKVTSAVYVGGRRRGWW
jgi:DNA polymerase III alpha subunit (gram-positive type)